MKKRYCYRCRRRTEHECGMNRDGDYLERCRVCGHVNRTATWEWRMEMGSHDRLPLPLGATLRRMARA